jgi:hypothetical protein
MIGLDTFSSLAMYAYASTSYVFPTYVSSMYLAYVITDIHTYIHTYSHIHTYIPCLFEESESSETKRQHLTNNQQLPATMVCGTARIWVGLSLPRSFPCFVSLSRQSLLLLLLCC